MPNPIPDFDNNSVLPPHLGDPRDLGQLSPYPCTTVDLCQRFGTTPERRIILLGFLDFRKRLYQEGLTTGFQWLDGSFLENVELLEKRPPRDLDVVTVFWGYDTPFLVNLSLQFPEVRSRNLAKANFSVDHFPFDAGMNPQAAIEWTRYWMLLFSHNRNGVWKGMLKIELDTPTLDEEARKELENTIP